MGNNTLSYKESTTYLGLILDSKLTWDLQIKETKKKITKYCSIFSKVRHFLPKRCRLELYNAFIFSRLNYGIEICLNTTKSYTKKLLSTQNRLLKILQFKPFQSNINKLYTDFEVLKPMIYMNLTFTALCINFIIDLMWFLKQLKTSSFNMKIFISTIQDIKETVMLSLLIQQHMVKELWLTRVDIYGINCLKI